MTTKKLIAVLVAIPLLSISIFSVAITLHESEGSMNGCPFSAAEASPCPQNAVAVAMHHLSSYQSLFSAPVDSGAGMLLAALLFVLGAALLFSVRPPVLCPPARAGYVYDPPSLALPVRKTLRWLSLFERSPSFIRSI